MSFYAPLERKNNAGEGSQESSVRQRSILEPPQSRGSVPPLSVPGSARAPFYPATAGAVQEKRRHGITFRGEAYGVSVAPVEGDELGEQTEQQEPVTGERPGEAEKESVSTEGGEKSTTSTGATAGSRTVTTGRRSAKKKRKKRNELPEPSITTPIPIPQVLQTLPSLLGYEAWIPVPYKMNREEFRIHTIQYLFGLTTSEAERFREITNADFTNPHFTGPTDLHVEAGGMLIESNRGFVDRNREQVPYLRSALEIERLLEEGGYKGLLYEIAAVGTGLDKLFADPEREKAREVVVKIRGLLDSGEWAHVRTWMKEESAFGHLISLDPASAIEAGRMGVMPPSVASYYHEGVKDELASTFKKYGPQRADVIIRAILGRMKTEDIQGMLTKLAGDSLAEEYLPALPLTRGLLQDRGIDIATYKDREEGLEDLAMGTIRGGLAHLNPFEDFSNELDYWYQIEGLPEEDRLEATRLGKEHLMQIVEQYKEYAMLGPYGPMKMGMDMGQDMASSLSEGIENIAKGNYRSGMEKITPVVLTIVEMKAGLAKAKGGGVVDDLAETGSVSTHNQHAEAPLESGSPVLTTADPHQPVPSSPIVPGGGLRGHEAPVPHTSGGHTIEKHVGKTESELLQRLADDPHISGSSSFYDRASAEAAISKVIDNEQLKIDDWLQGPKPRLRLEMDVSDVVGISIERGETQARHVSKVRVILARSSSSSLGYFILTAFPIP